MSAAIRRHRTDRFVLESGRVLEGVEQAYTLTGALSPDRDNLVVLFHSLTGGADPGEWWPRVVGPGRAIDTDRFAVLGTNLLGSCYGTTPPPPDARVTPRDMAHLVRPLVDSLGVESVALAAGGSLGGMVTLEWVATFPELTRSAVVFAAPAAHTAHAIALNHVQREALRLGGDSGLALARMVAMISYRTARELGARFGRERREDGRFQVSSYLDHHGSRLRDRFEARAYGALLDAMDAHDVGRGRGGTGPALSAFHGELVGVGIEGDRLYEPDTVRTWTEAARCSYAELRSSHGHDAFLLEPEQVAGILRRALHHAAVLQLATRGTP